MKTKTIAFLTALLLIVLAGCNNAPPNEDKPQPFSFSEMCIRDRFSEVLELVGGRAPIIVEVKHYGSATHNAAATLRTLRAYRGPYCVESFHPLAVRYFKKHAPDIVRGQLAAGGRWNRGELGGVEHFAMKHLLVNAVGRPHFVAYSVPEDHTLAMWLMKRVYKPLLAAWTIRSQEVLSVAEKAYDYPIFELFTPARKDRNLSLIHI